MATYKRNQGKKKKGLTQMSVQDIKAARRRKELEKDLVHPEFTPSLPTVDLFPANVREGIAVKKTRKGIMFAGVAVIIGLGAMWWVQGSNINNAQENLVAAEAENAELQTQIRALTPVKALYEEITNQEAIVNSALAADVSTRGVIDSLNAIGTTSDVVYSNLAITYSGSPKSSTGVAKGRGACPAADPFSTMVTVGCVSFNGDAPSRDAIAAFLTAAEEDPFFTSPVLGGTSSTMEGVTNFNGTVAITPEALVVPLSPEQLDALMKPPEPEKKPTDEEAAADTGGIE